MSYDEFDEDIKLNNLLIVDSLNYAFKFKHKGIKNFAALFVRDIASFAKSYKADNIIILGDGGSKYRKEIFPEYKSNRIHKEEEREEFEEFLAEYGRALELCKWPVIKFKGVEADDIFGYLVSEYSDNFDEIWMLSTDRDLDLLLKEGVNRFSYINRKEINSENFEKHYDYPYDMHISMKVLSGDAGDGVPGVAGIGHKRAYGLIREYGTAYDIIAALPIPGNQKFIQELNKSKELLMRNYLLFDILETYNEAIGQENINKIKEILKI